MRTLEQKIHCTCLYELSIIGRRLNTFCANRAIDRVNVCNNRKVAIKKTTSVQKSLI